MTGARHYAKQRERERDAQIKAMRAPTVGELVSPEARAALAKFGEAFRAREFPERIAEAIGTLGQSVGGSSPPSGSTGAGSQPAANGVWCPVSASPGKPLTFCDRVDDAIVAMPVIAVHENTRAVAYVSRVVRRGEHGGPRVRVAVYTYHRPGPGADVRVMTRSSRGWEYTGP